MKHSLKIPQEKKQCFVSYLDRPLNIELNEIKIKNIKHGLECHLPKKLNESSIAIIEDIDKMSYNTLIENIDWYNKNDEDLDLIYKNSYLDDISHLNLLINNKTKFIFNNINKDFEDLIQILNNSKKFKDYNINIEIGFLGLFIYDDLIINKWIIKTINIEELNDDYLDWNKTEIELDWINEIDNYENIINDKIETYNKTLLSAKKLLEEIKNETNITIWEKKILKLKKYILKI
jgi:hypothetical protein